MLTVLVFKDNATARTFRIPLRWITQFGWLLAVIFLTVLLSLSVTLKVVLSRTDLFHIRSFSRSLMSASSPSSDRIHQLEDQLRDAQSRLQALTGTSQTGSSTAQATEGTPMPVVDPSILSVSSPLSGRPFLFKALPDQIQAPPANPDQVPIALTLPSAHWVGKMLKVHFNLQYVSKEPGGQQGRIIILARGPGALLAHPNDVLQPVGNDFLLNPNRGEYFSVSRFRETNAEFGPVPSHDWLKEVEVIIVSSKGQLLIHKKIIPGASSGKAPVTKSDSQLQTKPAAVSPATTSPATTFDEEAH